MGLEEHCTLMVSRDCSIKTKTYRLHGKEIQIKWFQNIYWIESDRMNTKIWSSHPQKYDIMGAKLCY
jgi:hypothetical protein